MPLTLVTGPVAEPLTLAEAKRQLRLTTSSNDTLVNELIQAARSHLDGATGILQRALVRQTWKLTLPCFPYRRIWLPLPPLASVGSVTYVDTAGATQTLASSKYQVVLNGEQKGWIAPVYGELWPTVRPETDEAVAVTFTAGYAPDNASPADHAANVPVAIKRAMLLLIRHWFDNPSAVVTGTISTVVQKSVDDLLAPHKVPVVV